MVWAVRLEAEAGSLVGRVLDARGNQALVPISDLVTRGVPHCASDYRRKRIETSFQDWKPCDAEEYLAALGLTDCEKVAHDHKVYEAVVGQARYVVPALVWLRALFRPTKNVLPLAFGPQVIERLCRLVHSDEATSLHVDADWIARRDAKSFGNYEQPMAWMRCHPSAAAMAASVHSAAMNGSLDLRFPVGTVRLVPRGLRVGQVTYVTEMTIISVIPGDEPEERPNQLKEVIAFSGWVCPGERSAATSSAELSVVPLRATGHAELLDDEWAAVSNLFDERKRYRRTENTRAILNGILVKLATKKPWRSIDYKGCDWRSASTTFRRWAQSGHLQAILDLLESARR